MPNIQLLVSPTIGRTGRLLATALRERGCELSAPATCRVSYGVPLKSGSLPTLNGNASKGNKYEQMVKMAAAGVTVPAFFTEATADQAPAGAYPLLARRNVHKGGTDIKLVFQRKEIPWRVAAGSDFFVSYIPWDREYRVWIYRDRHLGTYEKLMERPSEYRYIGGNHRNGFAFRLVTSDNVPRGAVTLAKAAVNALRLDFGAVDILEAAGVYYGLEVNSAPGAETVGRQAFSSLADCIAKWAHDPR